MQTKVQIIRINMKDLTLEKKNMILQYQEYGWYHENGWYHEYVKWFVTSFTSYFKTWPVGSNGQHPCKFHIYAANNIFIPEISWYSTGRYWHDNHKIRNGLSIFSYIKTVSSTLSLGSGKDATFRSLLLDSVRLLAGMASRELNVAW